jgi:hypothetical protein
MRFTLLCALRLVQLDAMIQAGPRGLTPLCAALRDLVAEIQAAAPRLMAAGKTVTVIVASDGEVSLR